VEIKNEECRMKGLLPSEEQAARTTKNSKMKNEE